MRPKPSWSKDKRVYLEFEERHSATFLNAVDHSGRLITCLIKFDDNQAISVPKARDKLIEEGFDISFAGWDDNGGISLISSKHYGK